MPLPKVETPSYTTNLISDNKEIKFRPFLVKEEKILLLALETEDAVQIATAVNTILRNCILTENIKTEEMPSFDAEYLFLRIREKSLGEAIDVRVTCPDTNKKFDVSLNLSDIKIEKSKKLNNKIKVDEKINLLMKYPTMELMQRIAAEENSVKKILKIIMYSIDSIYDSENTYNPKDYTEKELQEFVESLPQSVFTQINDYYNNFPKIVFDTEVKSPFTGNLVKVRLDNFMDFFV
jgi:hypothetical protein